MTALTTLTSKLASRLDMGDGSGLIDTLKATAFKGQVSDAQMTALMVVANQYGLNPWTKEIYAFPDKNNGIVPVVGVDGWSRIINNHQQFDGMEFEQDAESCTCIIFRKDRNHPIKVTEYMAECKRPNVGPWTSHPRRMLRHKAMIQCARIAFGYGGIYDQDEAERIVEEKVITGEVIRDEPKQKQETAKPGCNAETFWKNMAKVQGALTDGSSTPEYVIEQFQKRYTLTADQLASIRTYKKSEAPAEGMTFARVADALNKAGDTETLDVRADLIRQVSDEQQRAELADMYRAIRDKMMEE
ncbi:MAG: phage recombination protein Bet [Propionivibrio sp.]|nr:phage recombination protein Bet [Propionivibrio sp.]